MDTTLNVRAEVLEEIARSARLKGISRSKMIAHLLKKVSTDISEYGKIGRLVQYQTRERTKNWRVFHVQPREDEYEYWLDMRKLLKMSVSLILALAVKRYLSKSLTIKTTDNNQCKNYIIIKEVIDSVIVWKLVWGWPPNLKKIFNPKHSYY